jgi:hypothetical protein
MNQKTLCFTRGLSRQDIETSAMAYYVMSPPEARLHIVPISDALLSRRVQDVIVEQGEKTALPDDSPGPAREAFRAVLIHSEERDIVMPLLKSFKSSLPHPGDIAFAVITETALTWTFAYYLDHLSQEHEYMKTHRPQDDPDMKPM